MIELTYPNILTIIEKYLPGKRSESAAFLIWYLENYLRLDGLDATDCVCDQRGDKGVDGIYLNTDANLIEVYQSKLFQKTKGLIGDKLLREFQGTLSQFDSEESLRNVISTAGDADVARLIKRLDLIKHLPEFRVIGYFICNGELDGNGEAYLRSAKNIRFIGKSELEATYVSAEREIPQTKQLSFSVTGYDVAEYIVDKEHRAVIAPVKALELVTMNGIANQAVFAFNVRGPLGRTQVNRDIAESIEKGTRHKLFPLFHSGITVIADKVMFDPESPDTIRIKNYGSSGFRIPSSEQFPMWPLAAYSLARNPEISSTFFSAFSRRPSRLRVKIGSLLLTPRRKSAENRKKRRRGAGQTDTGGYIKSAINK